MSFVSLLLCFSSCVSFRKDLYSSGGESEMIHNAIVDFINTEKRLLNKHDLFCVQYDSLGTSLHKVCIFEYDEKRFSLIVKIRNETNIRVETRVTDTRETFISTDTVLNKPVMIVNFTPEDELESIWFDEDLVIKSYDLFPDCIYEWEDNIFFWDYSKSIKNSDRQVDDKIIELLYRKHYVDTSVWCYNSDFFSEDVVGKMYLFDNKDLKSFKKERIR